MIVEQPPNTTSVMVDNRNSQGWMLWFDKLHYFLIPSRNQQAITATNSINVDANYVSISTASGAVVLTLGASTSFARRLQIQMIARTNPNNATMALTNVVGGTAATTCTWNAVGQSLLLESDGLGKWIVIKQYGVTLT